MPKLIDDLRARSARLQMPMFVSPSKQRTWANVAKRVHEAIMSPDLPVIDINNVTKYYYSASDQEYWDLRDHFPNLAPPYPAMWFESKLPTLIHSKECGDTDVGAMVPNGRVGVLLHGLDMTQCKFEPGYDAPANTRWILWGELFIDFGKRGITADGPHGSMFIAVDSEGVIIDRPWMQSFIDDVEESPEMLALMRSHITWLYPPLLAISFLHCKNVTMVDNEVPKPLAKKYKERHGIAPTSYKTLVIEPLKKILRTEGRSDTVGVQKAIHICRGHFRDYREGRGLFGKLHGQYWMPMTVRGPKGEKPPAPQVEVKI